MQATELEMPAASFPATGYEAAIWLSCPLNWICRHPRLGYGD